MGDKIHQIQDSTVQYCTVLVHIFPILVEKAETQDDCRSFGKLSTQAISYTLKHC
jgi:hypothetical protein